MPGCLCWAARQPSLITIPCTSPSRQGQHVEQDWLLSLWFLWANCAGACTSHACTAHACTAHPCTTHPCTAHPCTAQACTVHACTVHACSSPCGLSPALVSHNLPVPWLQPPSPTSPPLAWTSLTRLWGRAASCSGRMTTSGMRESSGPIAGTWANTMSGTSTTSRSVHQKAWPHV